MTSTVSGGRKTFSPPGSVNPGQVVADAWFSMNASSFSDITNTGVRGANGTAGSPYAAGAGWGANSSGWAWATTGSQSSMLDESVSQTTESASSLVSLQLSTSATELGSSASVLRTDSGGAGFGSGSGSGSGSGGSWSTTSTMGSYSNAGMSGIYGTAYALVPVGADGLAFALGGTATNLVGDYLISTGSDLLGSGSDNPPGAEGLTRGWGTQLTSQQTLASPPGAATTNLNNIGNGSGSSYSSGSGGYTAYGNPAEAGAADSDTANGAMSGSAGLKYIKTTGQIAAGADAAAHKQNPTPPLPDKPEFPECDGDCHCTDLEPGEGDACGSPPNNTGIDTVAQTGTMPKELDDETRAALEEEEQRLLKQITDLNREIMDMDKSIAQAEQTERPGGDGLSQRKRK